MQEDIIFFIPKVRVRNAMVLLRFDLPWFCLVLPWFYSDLQWFDFVFAKMSHGLTRIYHGLTGIYHGFAMVLPPGVYNGFAKFLHLPWCSIVLRGFTLFLLGFKIYWDLPCLVD